MPKALKPVGRPVLRTISSLEHEKPPVPGYCIYLRLLSKLEMFLSFVPCLVFVSVRNSGNQKKKHLAFAEHSREGVLTEKGQEVVAKLIHSLKSPNYTSNPLPSQHGNSFCPLSIFSEKSPIGKKEQLC